MFICLQLLKLLLVEAGVVGPVLFQEADSVLRMLVKNT